MSIIHYAVEVFTNTTVSNTTYGIQNGVFRFITDRPLYDGSTVVPKYGLSEIDIDGSSLYTNTHIWYQDWLLKDGFSGNPSREIDITSAGNYGNSSSFSFQITNAKVSGASIWKFCENNGIYLTNSTVRIWVVIDDVFYCRWHGKVENTPFSETYFEFDCMDDANTLHRIIPPTQKTVVTNTQTNVSQVTVTTSTSSTVQVPENILIDKIGYKSTTVTVPVVLGDVCYSPVVKVVDANPAIVLTGGYTTGDPRSFTAPSMEGGSNNQSFAYVRNPNGSTYGSQVQLLTTSRAFAAHELAGLYLQVVSGKNANTDKLYLIGDSAPSENSGFVGHPGKYTWTLLYLYDRLLDANGELIIQSDFNDLNKPVANYAYPQNPTNPYPTPDIWWFQVAPLSVSTVVSNNSSTIDIQKNNLGRLTFNTYDKNTEEYLDLSQILDTNSTETTVNVHSNNTLVNGQVQILERILFPLTEVGLKWPGSTNNYENAQVINHTNDPIDLEKMSDLSRLTYGFSGSVVSSSNYLWIYSKFQVEQLLNNYDKIYYLLDLTFTANPTQTVSVIYPANCCVTRYRDIYNNLDKANATGEGASVTTNDYDTISVPSTGVSCNLIPNSFYNLLNIVGDSTSKYENCNRTISSATSMYKDVYAITDSVTLDAIKSLHIEELECAMRIYNPTFTNFNIKVKQVTLLGQRTIDALKSDLYTTLSGEITGATATDATAQTNNVYDSFVHILEDYDKIPKAMIDYGNLPLQRNSWHVGRALTDQQNSINYLTQLACQSFVGLFGSRQGKRTLRAWEFNSSPAVTTGAGKISLHDNNLVIADSIKSYSKTDFSQCYNSFNIKYDWDPGQNKYNSSINITNVDQTSFPSISQTDTDGSLLWEKYVSGLPSNAYADSSQLWGFCNNSYLSNKTIRQAQDDVQKCDFYIDRSEFEELAPDSSSFINSGSGVESSAFKLLQLEAWWTTQQKDLVQYSIPLNANTYATEIMDVVNFNDMIYTDSTSKVGWITAIEDDLSNDSLNLTAILISNTMQTTPSFLDERVSVAQYVDSLDERSTNTDFLDER
jgi:hypothetical protein